jgi:SPP1 gp7 family putative phage head morphogenesis protein
MSVNTQIYDKTVDRTAMLRYVEAGMNEKITKLIDTHELTVSDIVKRNQPRLTPQLKKEIADEVISSASKLHSVVSRDLLELVQDQLSYSYQILDAAIGKIWKTARPTQRVAEEIVLTRPLYNDVTLSAGWNSIAANERKHIEQAIREGIAKGMSEDELALYVRKSSAFRVSRQQSLGLARTAMTSVYSQSDMEIYKANEKALQGYQYVAILDSRTTPLCASRDGSIYPVGDYIHLPPAHWYCRSTTVPVVKDYESFGKLDNVTQVRKNNFKGLTPKQIAEYDGQTGFGETYNAWLFRQPLDVQLRHLGDYKKLEMFRSGQLTVDKFVSANGKKLTIKELRQLTDSGYALPGDTMRFASAKEKLDAIRLGAPTPEALMGDPEIVKALKEYYLLQAGELDGTLSLTNYRGTLIHTKKNTKQRVLSTPPREENIKYNPLTGQYEDMRMYQPAPNVLLNNIRLIDESPVLKPSDKEFLNKFLDGLEMSMGANERAVVADNLRIIFTRYRTNGEAWGNLKAVLNGQMKFDVMNVSDAIETQLRKDINVLHKLKTDQYIDPVLGPVQLQDLHDTFIDNIHLKNKWEDTTALKIGRELRNVLDYKLPLKIKARLSESQLRDFYTKFAQMLATGDTPDRDQMAIMLGRSLYNSANFRGSRNEWYNLGVKILDSADNKGFYKLETFGVQKRRMKSRNGGKYFGPYYDTFSMNLRIVDPRIQEYAKLTRKVDLGLRISVTDDRNVLKIRPGYKTYFDKNNRDTRIPITSSHSFSNFPVELVDDDMANALNWTASTKYTIDPDFFDFAKKLLFFEDDKGRSRYFNELNQYREFMVGRGDAYERLKAMEWLREKNAAFSNHPFLDHRARIYDRGLISPQSGETFRPFLSTQAIREFSPDDFYNLQDQIGSFIGGLNDKLEGPYNSLSITGRQKIAERWRNELIRIGNHMRRAKPNDIRAVLESDFMALIDGEEQGKALRFALEMAKINDHVGGDFVNIEARIKGYKTALALEQDASSSGAQIIALTTKNRQLADLSNVTATMQKQRLYDEIAAATYNDERFRKLNERFGLTEKDLRKAAKAQNMVTFYGAGERTGIMNAENKLAKTLGKDTDVLVIKAADRDTVLNEISARMARYEKLDYETYLELKALRQDVKDVFNKGLPPGDEIMDQLFFLDPKTRDLVERMTRNYNDIVTPNDFQQIAMIMSEHLREQVPILKDFTRFFGRLASEYLENAKPSASAFDWKSIAKISLLGEKERGYTLPRWLSELLGLKANEPVSEKILKRFDFYRPDGPLSQLIFGVEAPGNRRVGAKYLKLELADLVKLSEIEVLYTNNLPKSWTNIPWVNFDGKTIEQNFTQTFEERLRYKDAQGKWITNIVQVDQKTDPTWWQELINKDGKINDIADGQKARTAFAVNGNHSNDATLVKQFHLWGKSANVPTSTIHDAFFANAADMLKARWALRKIYARVLDKNVIKDTLDEMRARGLPKEIYDRYLNEAIDIGLIPVAGRSRVGGKLVTETDILRKSDVLEEIPSGFKSNRGWYGIG